MVIEEKPSIQLLTPQLALNLFNLHGQVSAPPAPDRSLRSRRPSSGSKALARCEPPTAQRRIFQRKIERTPRSLCHPPAEPRDAACRRRRSFPPAPLSSPWAVPSP